MKKITKIMLESIDWIMNNVEPKDEMQSKIRGCLQEGICEILHPTAKTIPYAESLVEGSSSAKKTSGRKE